MIPLILTMGCIFFICIGTGLASWGGVDIRCEGPNVNNIVTLLVGIGIIAFGIFSMTKASDYYHEKESPKTEITTSVPAQIDTIIIIRNSVPDTAYVYKFSPKEQ